MGVGSFYYLNGNYGFGILDHANGMKSSIPWASAGIAGDALSLGQLLGTSGASLMGATNFARAAATPIINAGLITLTVAGNQLGFGRPEDGERFGNSSSQFNDAYSELLKSTPPDDWQGTGSDAYGDRNAEQQTRAADMSSYDRGIQEVLAEEAKQVDNTREFVSKRQTVLGLSIAPALAAKLIVPAGPAISTAIEVAAVAGTVPFAVQRIDEMISHSSNNANAISDLASRYDELASGAEMPGEGFGS
jgi:hypothetical protein